MPESASPPELFPAPAEADWRTRLMTPTWGSRLKVRMPGGRLIEGVIVTHEKVRAGVLVTLRTKDGVEEVVIPHLEITVPLPFDESDSEQRSA